MFTIPQWAVNASGYNALDGYLYAMPAANYSPAALSVTTLVRIDKNGAVETFSVTPPSPSPGAYNGGCIDDNGIFWLTPQAGSTTFIYYIDLKSQPYVTKRLSFGTVSYAMPDIVYNRIDGKLYGVNSFNTGGGSGNNTANGKLTAITVDMAGGTATLTSLGMGVYNYSGNATFGALYVSFANDAVGDVYAYSTNALWYRYNFATGERTSLTSNPIGGGTGDAISCPGFQAAVATTKDDGLVLLNRGETTTYTITVSNTNGLHVANNVQVADNLPAGIPTNNMSYKLTALNGGASSTHTINSSQSGALSDMVTIPVGGSVVYEVTIVVPENYPYLTLPNTATATLDNLTIDLNLSDNEATDIDDLNPSLPVIFGNINALIEDEQLQVNWSTLTEVNNTRFKIEASADGKTFVKIGEVETKAENGNSNAELHYDFSKNISSVSSLLGFSLFALAIGFTKRKKLGLLLITYSLLLIAAYSACNKKESSVQTEKSGKIFIRIKQIDTDGNYQYSKVVQAINN
jgi:uncharacterized repeat protein (TIGR01451 family)